MASTPEKIRQGALVPYFLQGYILTENTQFYFKTTGSKPSTTFLSLKHDAASYQP